MPWNEDDINALEAEFDEDAKRVRELVEGSEPPDEDETPDPDVDEVAEVEPPAEEPETETPPAEPQFVDVAGKQLRVDEAQALVEFYEWARQHPDAMAGVNGYLSGAYDLVPRGQEQPPPGAPAPEDEDWEDVDPVIRKKFEELEALRTDLDRFQQAQYQAQIAQERANLEAGKERFNQKFGLDETQMQALETETAQLGILPSLIAKHNGDKITAVEEALETAYWRSPEFRAREFERQQEVAKKDTARKTKASKLAGSSGSVPRNQANPSTPEQRRESMIAEIAEAMQNN